MFQKVLKPLKHCFSIVCVVGYHLLSLFVAIELKWKLLYGMPHITIEFVAGSNGPWRYFHLGIKNFDWKQHTELMRFLNATMNRKVFFQLFRWLIKMSLKENEKIVIVWNINKHFVSNNFVVQPLIKFLIIFFEI